MKAFNGLYYSESTVTRFDMRAWVLHGYLLNGLTGTGEDEAKQLVYGSIAKLVRRNTWTQTVEKFVKAKKNRRGAEKKP